MPPRDTALHNAIVAHHAGRLTEAEVGYSRVLRKTPATVQPADRAAALFGLGLLHFHRGEAEAAARYLSQSVELEPSNARAWSDLGGVLVAAGRVSEAKAAYRRSTEVAPDRAEGWYNLAVCLRKEEDIEGAITHFRAAIARQPDYSRAREALAALLYQAGRTPEAAEVYREWARHDPTNAKARHMAAAASGHNVPNRASDEYVRELFDSSAKGFDANLHELNYRAPELVADALVDTLAEAPADTRADAPARAGEDSPAALTLLDAGCGTGLCGPRVRPLCRRLEGVDLSPAMLEHARARGCYDELTVAEITEYLRSHPNTYDAIIAADTLVYFGALEEPLAAARAALRPSGVFVFTLEAQPMGADPGTQGHRLELHGRYTHTESYARQVVADSGFHLQSITRDTLRQERLKDVAGYVVTARRREQAG